MSKIIHTAIIFLIFSAYCTAQNFDIDLLQDINQNRNSGNDKFFNGISRTTYPASLALPVFELGVGLIKKDRKLQQNALFTTTSLIGAMGTTYILKKVINRPRPYEKYPFIEHYYTDTDSAFPSGHTSAAFSMATSLSLHYRKWYVVVPAYAWASAVGYSRMHLGMHYPSDVAAGALIGAGSAFVNYKIQQWINKKSR
ncbi:MAG: phosphatase PAP2 family protein [Spirosomataceae bacterium]